MRCCPRLCVYQLVLRANVSANRQKWRGLHQSNVIPIEINRNGINRDTRIDSKGNELLLLLRPTSLRINFQISRDSRAFNILTHV